MRVVYECFQSISECPSFKLLLKKRKTAANFRCPISGIRQEVGENRWSLHGVGGGCGAVDK